MAAGDPLDGPDGPTPPKPPTQDGIFDVAAVAADGGPSPKGKGAEYGPTDEEAAEGESDLNQYRFLVRPRWWSTWCKVTSGGSGGEGKRGHAPTYANRVHVRKRN